MRSEMLEWVYKCLLEDEEVIIPLKKLWKRRYGLAGEPSFEEFAEAVLSDQRFEQMYWLDHDPCLEAFGYFAGPRVKLRSREITGRCVFRIMQKHNERILQVLLHALKILHNESSAEDINEIILMLEGLQPLFKPWVHFKPKDHIS